VKDSEQQDDEKRVNEQQDVERRLGIMQSSIDRDRPKRYEGFHPPSRGGRDGSIVVGGTGNFEDFVVEFLERTGDCYTYVNVGTTGVFRNQQDVAATLRRVADKLEEYDEANGEAGR
jgi:hypothetical protein